MRNRRDFWTERIKIRIAQRKGAGGILRAVQCILQISDIPVTATEQRPE
jgi:hypothetical protein